MLDSPPPAEVCWRHYIDGTLVVGPTSAGLGTPSVFFEMATYANAAGGKFGGTIDEFVAALPRPGESLDHLNGCGGQP